MLIPADKPANSEIGIFAICAVAISYFAYSQNGWQGIVAAVCLLMALWQFVLIRDHQWVWQPGEGSMNIVQSINTGGIPEIVWWQDMNFIPNALLLVQVGTLIAAALVVGLFQNMTVMFIAAAIVINLGVKAGLWLWRNHPRGSWLTKSVQSKVRAEAFSMVFHEDGACLAWAFEMPNGRRHAAHIRFDKLESFELGRYEHWFGNEGNAAMKESSIIVAHSSDGEVKLVASHTGPAAHLAELHARLTASYIVDRQRLIAVCEQHLLRSRLYVEGKTHKQAVDADDLPAKL